MQTATEIAAEFASRGAEPRLELAILRHMEHHMKLAADIEREACAKIAENGHKIPIIGDLIAPESGQLIANIIRERNNQT